MWSWLASAAASVLAWLLKIVAAPAVQEARQTGAAQEAASEAVAGEKAAQAQAQAAVDAPKDRAGVEKELRGGTF